MHGTRFIRLTHHLTWWSPVTPASRGQTQFFRSELITGRLARTIADAEVAGGPAHWHLWDPYPRAVAGVWNAEPGRDL